MNRTFRLAVYACTLFSGMSALVFQVVWQRYLSFLIGNEGRSVSLVVGVFLFGLATGYHWWGRATEKTHGRGQLFRLYGAVELLIGLFALAFPLFFSVVQRLGYALPDYFVLDLALTILLLFVPTFLMGATIPLLTKALPETSEEVNSTHARIYGLNTLGACAGTWLAGLVLVPQLGLENSLRVGGMINLCVGLVFLFSRVAGGAVAMTRPPVIANRFGVRAIYLMAFAAGAASITLEVLFIRVFSLVVGSAYTVFPIVLGTFVLGLALGSLSLRRTHASAYRILAECARAVVLLVLIYFSLSYWPNWLLFLRMKLGIESGRYFWFLTSQIAFLSFFLLPVLYSLGRLLPLCYSLIDKDARNYGRVCGRLYFVNTAGTALGSCLLGYLALYVVSLDTVYKSAVVLLAAPALLLWYRQASADGKARQLRLLPVCAVLLAAFCLVPSWNRDSYYIGFFRTALESKLGAFKIFGRPSVVRSLDVEFYRDGPDATVSVTRYFQRPTSSGARISRSLVVNGKSDGNTHGDFSTMALVATLPYLGARGGADLNAAVVGLGTGITAGVLGHLKDVAKVTVVEISPTVIAAGEFLEEYNFQVRANPKISIVQADAFKYFTRVHDIYDLIVAEPSNPWMVGVENLYTPEFYRLMQRSLGPDGVYVQWFHLYEMRMDVMAGVFQNLTAAFPYANAFIVGSSDLAIVATVRAPPILNPQLRLREPFLQMVHQRAGLDDGHELFLLHLFDQRFMRWLVAQHPQPVHDLAHPWIAARANIARFYNLSIGPEELLPVEAGRGFFAAAGKGAAVEKVLAKHPRLMPQCLDPLLAYSPLCRRFNGLLETLGRLKGPALDGGWHQLLAYGELRHSGLFDADPDFLRGLRKLLLRVDPKTSPEMRKEAAILLLREYRSDGLAAEARAAEAQFKKAAIL